MANNAGNVSDSETSQVTQNVNQAPSYGDVNSSLIITNHRLDGKNFLQWSQSVLMVIRGRGKLGYINGEIPRPSLTDPTYATWELNNSIVMAWLINSMESHISRTYLLFKTAKEMWDAVKENYSDLGNASQVFEIKLKLKDIQQGTLEVTQYYNNLKILWQELDMYYEVDWGEGLEHTNSGHRPTESSALVSRAPQSQKNRVGNDSGQSRSVDRVWCSYCNRTGHTKENKALLSLGNSSTATPAPAEVVQDVRLTKSQLETLHKLLGAQISHGSLAIQGTEIGEDDWHC
ncbi:hypothetical protein HRI_001322800 [Hibiscus trionum]|uniref:Retrotransposon Copia-like N-terminal domain-containing protein n=1 Tax=Hibiscus trionum TaxID=183268 RepID=A0A9W7LVD5_HIBTR|nr:hypothetical protein HRI_001322800 [Hibiscus trionum]